MGNEVAYFGAGCFWHVELEFSKLRGVVETRVGFMGGDTENPSYKDVCKGDTKHVEVTKVVFSKDTSYDNLLELFWQIHDPTQVGGQGPDMGDQYRSVIFYTTEEQKKEAEKFLEEKQKEIERKITTTVEKSREFYEAEEYHQKYLEKQGKASCGI